MRSLRFALVPAIIVAGLLLMLAIAQEPPVGSIKGKAVAMESGNPLKASVNLTYYAGGQGEEKHYSTESKPDGTFSFIRIPAGEYKLEINSKAHAMKPVNISVQESKTQTITAELPPVAPYVDLYVHQHIFTPDEKPQVTCSGFVNSEALDLRLYKVDINAFLTTSSGSMERLLGIRSYYGNEGTSANVNLDANPALKRTDSMLVTINTRDLEGVFTQRIDLPLLAPGLYVASVKADNVQRLGWLMVTSIGLVTKTAGTDTLAYTVDLKTGAPISGADVTAYVGRKPVASGTTGSDGTLSLALPKDIQGENEETLVARKGDSVAFVSSYFDRSSGPRSLVYSYTDRPVYRPGQTVHFKGIVRAPTQSGYTVPASKPVTVEVRDPRDTLIYRATKRTDRFGSYWGGFDLNPETSTGYYSITTAIEGEKPGEPASFQVTAYRKPEFSVKVDFAKKRYIRGDTVRATVSAQYYFGAPVANAKVDYFIRRSPYWLFMGDQDMEDMQGYDDYGGYGEIVKEGQVTTDENGNAVIECPADWSQPKGQEDYDSDQQFSIEATVADKSNRYATGSGSVLATRGEFAIDMSPDKYVVQPGEKVNVTVRAMDYDKHPVKRQAVSITVGRMEWNGSEYKLEKLQEARATTDDSGQATIPVTISKPGDIRVHVSARDGRGNQITGMTYVWSYSEAYDYGEYGSYPDLQIVTDKKTYSPGDTAKVLINVKNPGATALVTIEGSRIYDRRTVLLKGKSTLVEMPITSEYRPNFYVSVCFVKNKEFASQEARAKVSLGDAALNIKVTPNKAKYKPDETAIYKIKATDSNGRPARAELSMGLVDEAIYAIAEDGTTPIQDYFYARRPNDVNTHFSFPQIYLSDPDKAGAPMAQKPRMSDIRVRKRFLDTAYWNPAIVTDSRGEATVSVHLPDNLTSWRATVRGITMGTACGQTTNNVIARQDFMVRLEMPRFLVQTDTATITAAIHNYTGRNQNVDVQIQAPGLKLDGGTTRRVRVADGQIARLDWKITAPTVGDQIITVRASGDNAGDAVQAVLPVHPYGVERLAMTAGSITGSSTARETITVRSDSVVGATRLKVRLAPSLASTMLGSLEYLAMYPWGCTEQTTSSFLPDVILSRSLKSLSVRNPDLERRLPDMVQKGLFRLYRFQLEGGGWGWYEYGEADPWMTAYVCYGLIQARDAGFPVNSEILNKGLSKLAELVSQEDLTLDTKVYGYYVLALAGRPVNESLLRLMKSPYPSSEFMAVLTLALEKTGQTEQAATTLRWLFDNAVVEPGTIHWTGPDPWMSDDVEATTFGLQAVLGANPADPRAMQIVRWLMQRRQGNYWYSTRDTAMVLYAMSEYFKTSNELEPDFTATVLVNGKPVGGKRFTKASIFDVEYEITVANRDLRKGRNSLEIRKSGPGNLYYTTELSQYVTGDLTPMTVTGSGLSITREYFHPSSKYYESPSDDLLGSPVTGCRTNDVVLVRLTINAAREVRHALVEDSIPAGCEIIDKGDVGPYDWNFWWSGQDVLDDKIAFYLDTVPVGKHVITYQMRAGFLGDYHALPAQIFAMYQPEIRASTSESRFGIR